MKRAERLESILELLSNEGSVAVSELTGRLRASPATVRRDLELLEQQKLLSRTHGGAVGNGTLSATAAVSTPLRSAASRTRPLLGSATRARCACRAGRRRPRSPAGFATGS